MNKTCVNKTSLALAQPVLQCRVLGCPVDSKFNPFTDCNCPKAKPRSDGKLVVDAICDKIGECMCPTVADAGEVTFTPNGCVVGGMLLLIDAYFVHVRNYLF